MGMPQIDQKIMTAGQARKAVDSASKVIAQIRLGAGSAGVTAFMRVRRDEALAQLQMYSRDELVWCEVIGERVYLGSVHR